MERSGHVAVLRKESLGGVEIREPHPISRSLWFFCVLEDVRAQFCAS